ncbi:MAG TPA: rhomboid family intramembrane serine protease [Planctomycetaceae bacterium]|nr:rhomboid family intramembrane serine protease [Planctomycetaceae bacterium]HIQ20361.1 rhomboid family intramembrane serine protease [Planctomycetota bacterium]
MTFPEINFRRMPATLTIAALVVALEIVCLLEPQRRPYYYNQAGLGILPTIWMGRWWQPFTTALLHGNLLHAAFNVFWLVTFGWALERRFGSFRYLGLVVLLAYLSMLPQFVVSNYRQPLDQQIAIVGLSGVVYGLFGILLVGRRRHVELEMACDSRTVQILLFWFVLCIGLTYAGLLPVANTAHGAGLVFGIGYGLVIFDPRHRPRWLALVLPPTFVVLATLVVCPGHRGYEAIRAHQRIQQILENPQPAPAGQGR